MAHGAPLLALNPVKGGQLLDWACCFPRPKAILVISAHWEATPLQIGILTTQPLIYDFYGFPPELYALKYPAPGAPELAERVKTLCQAEFIATQDTDRCWDHGVWVPLLRMYPEADIPLLQISLPSTESAADLFDLGLYLSPLRKEGVLIVASGNLTHNLRQIDFSEQPQTPEWAATFDSWCEHVLSAWKPDTLIDYRNTAPQLAINHPTLEHFLPLLMAIGAASIQRPTVSFPITGFEFGSLSRRCVQFD